MPQVVGPVAALASSISASAVVVNLAIAAGSHLLSSALRKRAMKRAQRRSLDADALNSITVDALSARSVVFGTSGLAGEQIFSHVHSDRQWASRVLVLADAGSARGYSLQSATLEGEAVTIGAGGAVTAPARFVGKAFIRFYAGTEAQQSDARLTTVSGGRWVSTRRGRGVCYVILETMDTDQTAFPNGQPEPFFTIRNEGVYDPRKDTTRGGSGLHRLNDPATWEPSSNGAINALNFAIGLRMGARRVVGLGMPTSLIDWSSWASAANSCQTQGWTIDGPVSDALDPSDVLDAFALHMGGRICTRRGLLACVPGDSWPTVMTLGENDLAGALTIDPFKSWRESSNTSRASYRSPAHRWEPVETAPISIQAWVSIDGGEIEGEPEELLFVNDAEKATRIVKLKMYRERAPRTISGPWKLRAARLSVGDFVRVQLPQYGLDEVYEVDDAALDPSGFRSLRLRQFDPAGVVWSASEALPPPAFAAIDRPDEIPADATGWTASPVSQTGGGASLPSIEVVGSPPAGIIGVLVEFRRAGLTQWSTAHDGPPGSSRYLLAGLPPSVTLEISVRYRNNRALSANRLLLTATSPASLIATEAGTITGVDVSELSAAALGVGRLSELILSIAERNFRRVEQLEGLTHFQGEPVATIIVNERTQRIDADAAFAETLSLIGAKSLDGLAFILDINKVRVSATESMATRLSTLSAADGTNAAAIVTEATTRATQTSALATSITGLTATVNGNTAAISTEATTRANQDNALATQITNLASTVSANTATISNEVTTRANETSALAFSLSTVTTTVNGNTASITSLQSSLNGVNARAYLRLNVNGYVSGWEIASTATASSFTIIASDFRVVDPTQGATVFTPFAIVGGTVRMHGVEVNTLAANSITAGNITADSITTAKIAIGAVDTSRILSASVSKPRIATTAGPAAVGAVATNWVQVQSLSVTLSGESVVIFASCQIVTNTSVSAQPGTQTARLLYNGNVIAQGSFGSLRLAGSTWTLEGGASITGAVIAPAAGAATFTLEVNGNTVITNLNVSARQIVVQEFLR